MLDDGVFWLSQTPDIPSIGWDADDQRICQWTKFKVKKTGKIFYVFNVHFYWRLKTAKAESGPLLIKKIREIAGNLPVLCMGDFNSVVNSPQIKAMKESLFDSYDPVDMASQDVKGTAAAGGDFVTVPHQRIDYIFHTKHFEVKDCKILTDVYNGNHHPSDHLPVTALLSF
ncbi:MULTISPECIES: endonuclease/exonuclease/phosphatase family protein [Sphingobacterium]|uniref:endonuclease/exonuclease/phosphatase family protein n=1 Tax=Sphingobacterium TaxID=28453 RepID=UPI000E845653|nr:MULTISPECIES: endonuclease/exonuclease/phosphatase family protein [Sphingobacterium]MBB1645487.1 hypothetical protein [Sphingobacterium sp. UME9]HAE69650.1 hypothetical protein [Sphingobacterium sp.]HBW79825.1 hypothetical protein [Sphingobacterium sp.]